MSMFAKQKEVELFYRHRHELKLASRKVVKVFRLQMKLQAVFLLKSFDIRANIADDTPHFVSNVPVHHVIGLLAFFGTQLAALP